MLRERGPLTTRRGPRFASEAQEAPRVQVQPAPAVAPHPHPRACPTHPALPAEFGFVQTSVPAGASDLRGRSQGPQSARWGLAGVGSGDQALPSESHGQASHVSSLLRLTPTHAACTSSLPTSEFLGINCFKLVLLYLKVLRQFRLHEGPVPRRSGHPGKFRSHAWFVRLFLWNEQETA